MPLVEEFGSDAVRYWACNGRPGTDTAVDTGVMKIGRRLAIKILNASKFSLGRLADGPCPDRRPWPSPSTAPFWPACRTWSTRPRPPSRSSTTPGPRSSTETFFWSFCDDYVELVKTRAYGEGDTAAADSARATLAWPFRCNFGSSPRSSPS